MVLNDNKGAIALLSITVKFALITGDRLKDMILPHL